MLQEPLNGASKPEDGDGIRRLSPRELQVLEMTSLGLTNAQVAAGLGVTAHAVKFHLASIYRRLGVANRTEAAVLFLRSKLVGSTDSSDGANRTD